MGFALLIDRLKNISISKNQIKKKNSK